MKSKAQLPTSPGWLFFNSKLYGLWQIRAFSLLELLVVVAIISLMAAMLLPAVEGFSGTASRRGAVNIVMNTIDQARIAALEEGRNVHVILSANQSPEPESLLVVREVDSEVGFEILGKRISLPKGIIFREQGVFEEGHGSLNLAALQKTGQLRNPHRIGILTFGPQGTVLHPNGSDNTRRIHIGEGFRNGSRIDWKSDGFDIVSVTRYTGRPQLDVSIH
ncbi:MAG: type II secretion system GspH family protein [Chthoniobacterales bacterium]|nr:type II secretion system GspH family protein [Chthoniobacterales bacterium]MCX7712853.1 type II secretion system GspH family protein [Chthoniobacterales bacterium]